MAKGNRGGQNKKENAMTSYKKLSQDEKDGVSFYTEVGYDINNTLRMKEILSSQEKMLQRDLDSAISKGQLKDDTTVYRGVSAEALGVQGSGDFNSTMFMDSKQIANQIKSKVGQTITDNGYLSTTTDVKQANKFAEQSIGFGVQLTINAKKGTKALYVGDNSLVGNESEMLFGRDTKLTIKSVTEKYGKVIVNCDLTD